MLANNFIMREIFCTIKISSEHIRTATDSPRKEVCSNDTNSNGGGEVY